MGRVLAIDPVLVEFLVLSAGVLGFEVVRLNVAGQQAIDQMPLRGARVWSGQRPCAIRTMHCVLSDQQEVRERRSQVRQP